MIMKRYILRCPKAGEVPGSRDESQVGLVAGDG